MADNKFIHDNGCKEAVCVDAGRVYDSCSEEDCTRYIHRWGGDSPPHRMTILG